MTEEQMSDIRRGQIAIKILQMLARMEGSFVKEIIDSGKDYPYLVGSLQKHGIFRAEIDQFLIDLEEERKKWIKENQ